MASSDDTSVRILSECSITPSHPTPAKRRVMFLAAPDIVFRFVPYYLRVLFYKLPADVPFASVMAQIKQGLANVLVDFYPVSGRLFEQPTGRLARHCNDAGVPFLEASCNFSFSALQADRFQYKPFFTQLAPHADVANWTGPDLPLFSVQVTRFARDEGFALGIAHTHTLGDGASQWSFMKSWSECSRGLPISMHPVHGREALGPKNLILPVSEAVGNHEEYEKGNIRSITQGEILDVGFLHLNVELVQHSFLFTSDMVRKLKQKATSSFPPSLQVPFDPISSLQALGAHIWKHVILAMDVDESKETYFKIVANMRARLDPPLPEAYYGNAVSSNAAMATRGELEKKSLGSIAKRIQEAVGLISNKSAKSFYGRLEKLHPSQLASHYKQPCIFVSDSPRSQVYDIDFGWGSPLCVLAPIIHREGEMVIIPGPEGPPSVDVSLALTHATMQRLKLDKSFLSF